MKSKKAVPTGVYARIIRAMEDICEDSGAADTPNLIIKASENAIAFYTYSEDENGFTVVSQTLLSTRQLL